MHISVLIHSFQRSLGRSTFLNLNDKWITDEMSFRNLINPKQI